MKKSIIALIVVAVIVAASAGYLLLSQKSTDDTPKSADNQSATAADKDSSADAATIKDEKLDNKLVDSFPEDKVPLYPGEIKSSLGQMSDYLETPEWNVEISTNDSFDDVDKSIRAAYAADGWTIGSDSKTGLGGTMLIARSSQYIVTITYDDMDEDGILINYGVSQQ